VTDSGSANAFQGAGRRGHYEVYYLTLNHRPTGLGLWLRYTVDLPTEGEGHCALWGHVFDPETPPAASA